MPVNLVVRSFTTKVTRLLPVCFFSLLLFGFQTDGSLFQHHHFVDLHVVAFVGFSWFIRSFWLAIVVVFEVSLEPNFGLMGFLRFFVILF